MRALRSAGFVLEDLVEPGIAGGSDRHVGSVVSELRGQLLPGTVMLHGCRLG